MKYVRMPSIMFPDDVLLPNEFVSVTQSVWPTGDKLCREVGKIFMTIVVDDFSKVQTNKEPTHDYPSTVAQPIPRAPSISACRGVSSRAPPSRNHSPRRNNMHTSHGTSSRRIPGRSDPLLPN